VCCEVIIPVLDCFWSNAKHAWFPPKDTYRGTSKSSEIISQAEIPGYDGTGCSLAGKTSVSWEPGARLKAPGQAGSPFISNVMSL